MAGSFVHSLRPVWMARWQEVAPRLRLWLLLAGYDVEDRSRVDLFYVPYLILFWLVWAFAMFSALSGPVATLLERLNPEAAGLAAVQLMLWALLAWALLALYRASRRSPLIFSPADAALLCQAPVDRRAVALIWFLSEWPVRALPFAAGALLMGFARYEVNHEIVALDPAVVLGYWADGLRGLSLVLPLHFVILALVWAAGIWRLHGRRQRPLLRVLPLVVLLAAAPLLLTGWQRAPLPGWWRALSWWLLAGFGQALWAPALLVAVSSALLALAILLFAARALNLGRAAQETSQLYSERVLARMGARQAAQQLKQERALGVGHRGSVLPAGAGWQATVWKETVRAMRGWRQGVWPWLGILALGIGLAVAPGWSTRLVALVFWVQVAANRTMGALRDNLLHWWLWRQQPFPAWQLVASALALPATLLVLLSLTAWLIGGIVPLTRDFAVGPLLPLLSVQVTLAAAWDLLAQIKPARLLAGQAPGSSILGLFLNLLLAALPLASGWLVARLTGVWAAGIASGALLSLLLAALLARMTVDRARRFA